MKQFTTTYVAMDTHKKTISVALAEGGRRGETRFIGEIPSRPEAVAKMVDRLAKKHGQLAFCYEAGPCGYCNSLIRMNSSRRFVVMRKASTAPAPHSPPASSQSMEKP